MKASGKIVLATAWALLGLSLLQWADQRLNHDRVLFRCFAGPLSGARPGKGLLLGAVDGLHVLGLVLGAFLARWLRTAPGLGLGRRLGLALPVAAELLAQGLDWGGALAAQASVGAPGSALLAGLGAAALATAGWRMQGLLEARFRPQGNLAPYAHLDPGRGAARRRGR